MPSIAHVARSLVCLAAALALAGAAAAAAPDAYDFVPAEWGVDFVRAGNAEADADYAEIMGSGACVFDYDGDGWEDLLLLNGKHADPALQAALDPRSALYRNLEGRGFAKVEGALDVSWWGMGCATGDYDADGDQDVAMSAWGGNLLYRNDGGGVFANVTDEAGVHHPFCDGVPCFGASLAFLDYDLDADLDLYVVNYLAWDGVEHASPGHYPAQCDVMFRNDGNGTFTDVTEETRTGDCFGNGLAVAIADADGDGWQDIFVASDETPDAFFLNNRDGTFIDMTVETGLGDPRGGMGAAWGDYDDDGRLDLAITHFNTERFALYRQLDGLEFEDRAGEDGLEVTRHSVGWGVEFVDRDNDADLDLLMVNGHVNTTYGTAESPYLQTDHVLDNVGGRFVEVTESAWHPAPEAGVSRGLAVADFDRDGYRDVVVTNNANESVRLWQSVRGPNNFLTLRLEGGGDVNPHALGAVVEVTAGGKTQRREVVAAASYLSQSSRDLHFGLGDALSVDRVAVEWPDGTRQVFDGVPANRALALAVGGALETLADFPVAAVAEARVLATRIAPVALAGSAHRAPAPIATSEWRVGGETLAGDEVERLFATLGTHRATYRVTDENGRWDEAEVEVVVENVAPVAVVSAPATARYARPVALDASASADADGDVVRYEWAVEGVTLEGARVEHAFSTFGDVEVRLTVTDSDGASATVVVVVHVPDTRPVPAPGGDREADRVAPVTFDATASADPDGRIVRWVWDFGDGASASCDASACDVVGTVEVASLGDAGPVLRHRYAALGARVATLTVTDDDGYARAASVVVTVLNLPPVARIDAYALANVAQALDYDGSASEDPDGGVVAYAWDMGDGTLVAAPVARHDFASTGARTVTLTVTDPDGATATASWVVDVVDTLDVTVTLDRETYSPTERPRGVIAVRFANGLPAPAADVDVLFSYRVRPSTDDEAAPPEVEFSRIRGTADAAGRLRFEAPHAAGAVPAAGGFVGPPSELWSNVQQARWGEHVVRASAEWRGNAGTGEDAYRVRIRAEVPPLG